MAASLTRDEIVKEGKELPDIVVIRADTDLPFRGRELRHYRMPETGISQVRLEDRAQRQDVKNLTVEALTQTETIMTKHRSDEDVELNVTAMLDMAFQLLAFFVLTFKPPPGEDQIYLKLPPAQPVAGMTGTQKAGADETKDPKDVKTDQVADGEPDGRRGSGSITDVPVGIPSVCDEAPSPTTNWKASCGATSRPRTKTRPAARRAMPRAITSRW